MNIESWYSQHFESKIKGRYVTSNHINPILKNYASTFKIDGIGVSELGEEIQIITIGTGSKKVLAWSQMHGNESTCTKAIFDLFKFLSQKDSFQAQIKEFLETYTLSVIPILNPDGAIAYTRENANNVDLNRDAQDLSQKESIILRKVFEEIQPDLCLNLHDQRTIYGLDTGLPATISFLSPAADEERTISKSRIESMKQIVKMNSMLQEIIPGQIGRYDDTFNNNCVGDAFQMSNVPTILFEAGHYSNDYQREITRKLIFFSFLSLFDILKTDIETIDYEEYFLIPKNKTNYRDLVLRGVNLDQSYDLTTVIMQYEERLIDGKIDFTPVIEAVENVNDIRGHHEPEQSIAQYLLNSQKKM